MKILSLDIASTTGWCLDKHLYGTWNFKTRKDESMGMKLIRFLAKLKEVYELEKFVHEIFSTLALFLFLQEELI